MNKSYIYLILASLLIMAEIFIGGYVHDSFIRPYGGDFLVVILLYCLVKSFINIPVFKTAVCVLLVACMTEVSQYFHLTRLLDLQNSKTAVLLLGQSFSWIDMLCYTLGIALVLIVEKISTLFMASAAKKNQLNIT